jgi:putative Mn2+ efflux pump MntP
MFVGLVLGAELAQAIGEPADYVGAGVFVLLGAYLLLDRDTHEVERVRKRISESVFGLIGLGISISPDELVAGFGLGLAHISIAAGFVAIALQGLIASQLVPRGGRAARCRRFAPDRPIPTRRAAHRRLTVASCCFA